MIKSFLTVVCALAGTSAMAAAAPTNAVVAPTANSTISTSAAAVDAKPKKVTASFVAENSVGAAAANRGNWDGEADSVQHLGLAYKLNEDQSVQFRQYFYYNATDAVKTDEYAMGEHMLRFTDAKALEVGAATVATDYRLYLPGSEYVKEVGQYQVRMDSGIEQAFGKATVSYGVSVRGYSYTGNSDGQISLRVVPAVGVEYPVNKVFTPHASINTDNRWYRNGRGVATLGPAAGTIGNPGANKDVLNTDIGTKIAINENINLDLYLETETDLHNGGKYELFNEDTNSYLLDLSVSM